MKLEDLKPGITVSGAAARPVEVIAAAWHGKDAVSIVFRGDDGEVGEQILYRADEARLALPRVERRFTFAADGRRFRLAAEAERIGLAHLFDPLLAIQTSEIEPLPHQITAVYEAMLPRQPLRFLLADDPGAGKTIMAGLLIRELMARSDVKRCLVVCPGSLVEQWQDELDQRFHLLFDILTRDKAATTKSGSWFLDTPLGIARLDMLARNDELLDQLRARDCRYDLIICDEAHKMSARWFGGEVKTTKRYQLGRILSGITRHLLLMTATPHNGIEDDFALFLALLDEDRFVGKPGRHRSSGAGEGRTDASDLMRRMVKEDLYRFDGRRLFPLRTAHTVPYRLSPKENELYKAVTAYVRDEFARAEQTANPARRRTVGFALTVLQRRLASSPEAIHSSLRRRRKRLEEQRHLIETAGPGGVVISSRGFREVTRDFLEDLDELPEEEIEAEEVRVLDQATAARTVEELTREIATLTRLEAQADAVRKSGQDTKWHELLSLLDRLFDRRDPPSEAREDDVPYGSGAIPEPEASRDHKLVLFTEHRDTLDALGRRIRTRFGRPEAVAVIHGGVGREERRAEQERFLRDPEVRVLLATDAAAEGINLQRAHLMVNYDLPWNPNRIEQRFGRIHRIGQRQVCHLWNLVAEGTREGDVYLRLLEKLERSREALGGKVFDVLGRLEFEGKPLRDLLLEAIRYGSDPEVRARLEQRVEGAVNPAHLKALLERGALAADTMDTSRLAGIRAEMERAQARRLQPHFIGSFFRAGLRELGGRMHQRETERWQISLVPATVRNAAKTLTSGRTQPVTRRYERVAFAKERLDAPRTAPSRAARFRPPRAAFLAPGHPLLDAVVALVRERHGDLLREGAVLVDEADRGIRARVALSLSHEIRTARRRNHRRQVLSERLLHVVLDASGAVKRLGQAPHLDYRPLAEHEPAPRALLALSECGWIAAGNHEGDEGIERAARHFAIAEVVPGHAKEVRSTHVARIRKTKAAVMKRLTREIAHWHRRSQELLAAERAGAPAAGLNAGAALRTARDLERRKKNRLEELESQAAVEVGAPRVRGGFVIVSAGLLQEAMGLENGEIAPAADTQVSAARARKAVMDAEKSLGFDPVDREPEKLGYDIESRDPEGGPLRFIEVKGRVAGADTITVTRNEIMTALNGPDQFILAIVLFHSEGGESVHYVREPFGSEPDFSAASVNYKLRDLLRRATPPS